MANKKLPKNNKMSKAEQDRITNRILAVFSLCLVGVMALWWVYNLLSNTPHYMLALRIISGARWVGVAAAAGSLALLLSDQKSGRNPGRLLSGRNLLVVSVVFTVMAVCVHLDPVRAVRVFYAILPALAIYYLIYHSYQPEFFIITGDCGVAALLLLLVRLSNGGRMAIAAAALAVVLAAAEIWYASKRLRGSKLPAGFGPQAFPVIAATAAVMAALVVIGMLAGAGTVFYLLCTVAAYAFVLAVYYTVKLM